jgi:geranylgeranyl diphosphate synthase, type II
VSDEGSNHTGAALLAATVEALASRAPAVVAAAAGHLGGLRLGLRFGDDSAATLTASRSRLLVEVAPYDGADVEVWFDARAMNLVFDLQGRAADELLPESLDVRGERGAVLATWRTFLLLSQRASGLRSVQDLWRSYRSHSPQLWGARHVPRAEPADATSLEGRLPSPRRSGWPALDYLDVRHPRDVPAAQRTVGGTARQTSRVLWDGRRSTPWWDELITVDADLTEVMLACRKRVAAEMRRIVRRAPNSTTSCVTTRPGRARAYGQR